MGGLKIVDDRSVVMTARSSRPLDRHDGSVVRQAIVGRRRGVRASWREGGASGEEALGDRVEQDTGHHVGLLGVQVVVARQPVRATS